jgi:NAD(P)-dependent dehydrogenase (short-subunit alcohol dehydrogenase family)
VTLPVSRPLALVTGASSGIGRELAKQFAEHGFDLIVAAEDVELDDAVEEIRGMGAHVAPVSVDLTKRADVERLAAAVEGAGRPLDAAALNAVFAGSLASKAMGRLSAITPANVATAMKRPMTEPGSAGD